MCATINLYYRLYDRHAGYPGQHHAAWVKQARRLIETHRRNCPECRGQEQRSNYNIARPKKLAYFKPRTK